jgi:dihydroorotase (multifunctional complex type)
MSNYDLIIKNGEICLPSGRFHLDIGIEGEKIVALAKVGHLSGRKELDVSGKIVLPGVIHTHVHMREPGFTHKEDYESGTKAAAAGGITCTIDMPNVIPVTTTVERYLEKKELASTKAYVDFQHWPAPTEPEEVYKFGKLGVVPGLKEFMVRDPKAQYPHIPELSLADHGRLFDLMKATAEIGLPMLVHGADPELMHALARPNLNDNSYAARFRSYNYNNWWFASRDIGSWVAIMIARLAGMRVHILHLGNGRYTHKYVRQAKEEGQDLTGEMEALWLIEKQTDPTRRKWLEVGFYRPECEYTEELWEAVNDGTVDVLVMEHAPHHRDEILAGENDIWNAPAGFPALQEMVPLLLTQVNKGKTSLEQFVQLISENPARLAGLYPRKGTIQVDSDADFTIVDMKAKTTIRAEDVISKAQISPWVGYTVEGIPIYTIVRGEIVMDNGKVIGQKGYGEFVPANHGCSGGVKIETTM